MPTKKYNLRLTRNLLIFLLAVLISGCTVKNKGGIEYSGPPVEVGRIVFLGFKPALSPGQEPALFLNPLTGGAVRSEPVSQSLADIMSDKMYTLLMDSKDYEFINLREIKNLTNPELFEESSNNQVKILQSVGKAVSADVVMTGYLYRMHEREGSELAAGRPASVAFDAYLVNVEDGSFLWKGRFDKTQKSLSENLLEIKSFLKFKGKWVDADTLAEVGLKELIDSMPLKNKE